MITLKNKRRGGGGVNGNIESESEEREWNGTMERVPFKTVSYTHLDVYKRQPLC